MPGYPVIAKYAQWVAPSRDFWVIAERAIPNFAACFPYGLGGVGSPIAVNGAIWIILPIQTILASSYAVLP
jgi:hypothetical protein